MKLFLAFVVCLVSMVDLRLAAAFNCKYCAAPATAGCATAAPASQDVSTAAGGSVTGADNCKTTLTIDAATTLVTAVRGGSAGCSASDATAFAAGITPPYTFTFCTTTPDGNSDAYSANSIGCYVCNELTAACSDPANNKGVKAFDATFKEATKSCSLVQTYKAGVLTSLVRARVETSACTAADTSASGDGTKTICCKDKVLCNDAVVVLPTTTMKPTVAATGAAKHAPKNIMNAFVLISAVILAVVSK